MDDFSTYSDTVTAPSRQPFVITPHNVSALAEIPKRLFIGTGGDVTLRGVDATVDVVYKNVGDGAYLNVRPQFVRATGTTASDILGEA